MEAPEVVVQLRRLRPRKMLREAGLVRVRADGSQRLYQVDTERLAEVRAALERFWGARLGRRSAAVTADREQRPAGGTR